MSTVIEIWKSSAGAIWPDDFALLTTVADGAPWHFLDSPTVPGELYIYRARRLDQATGIYSGWSPYAYVVGPYPTGGIGMLTTVNTNTNPGWEGYGGMCIEASPGQAVKVAKLMALISFDPDDTNGMTVDDTNDMAGDPDTLGAIHGDAKFKYKLVVAARPESFDELLYTAFPMTTGAVAVPATPAAPTVANVGAAGAVTKNYKIIASSPQGDSAQSASGTTTTANAVLSGTNYNTITWVAIAGATSYTVLDASDSHIVAITQALTANDQGQTLGAYVAPSAPTGNKQKWTSAGGFAYGTMVIYEGLDIAGNPIVHVLPGSNVDKLSINFDKGAKAPLQIDADMIALYDAEFGSLSATGLNTATRDTLDPYAPAFAVCMLAGAVASCNKYSVSIDRAKEGKGVFNGFAGDVAHYQGPNVIEMTLTLYWDDPAERKRFWGQVNSAAAPFGRLNNVKYFPLEISTANPVNGAGIVNQFGIAATYCTYKASKVKIDVKEKCLMQEVKIKAYKDPAIGYAMSIYNVNSRSNGSITTAGTLITGMPANSVNAYTS